MNRQEFSKVRHDLGKTQMQMAELLGISVKGIQSFEQGWREVPAPVERYILILLGMKRAHTVRGRACWSVKKCSQKTRRMCPVWEFQAGNLCWYFPVTMCQGKAPKSWNEKVKICRQCKVFQSVFGLSDRERNDRPGSKMPLAQEKGNSRVLARSELYGPA